MRLNIYSSRDWILHHLSNHNCLNYINKRRILWIITQSINSKSRHHNDVYGRRVCHSDSNKCDLMVVTTAELHPYEDECRFPLAQILSVTCQKFAVDERFHTVKREGENADSHDLNYTKNNLCDFIQLNLLLHKGHTLVKCGNSSMDDIYTKVTFYTHWKGFGKSEI